MDSSLPPARYYALLSQELMAAAHGGRGPQTVAERAVEVVAACDWVGLTWRSASDQLETIGSTDTVAVRGDDLQYRLGQGPCIEAALTEVVMLSQDLYQEQRWAFWTTQVVEFGIRSALSMPLVDAAGAVGALNLYSRRPQVWTPRDVRQASIYAAHAALALQSAARSAALSTQVQRQHRWSIALGMLAWRHGTSIVEADATLVALASAMGQEEAVRQVTEGRGLLPGGPGP